MRSFFIKIEDRAFIMSCVHFLNILCLRSFLDFLYDCVNDTIDNIIPREIQYLTSYDAFKRWLDDEYEMPDKTVALLARFLEQNEVKLSKRAQEKEFSNLEPGEVLEIEEKFRESFNVD